MPKVLAFCLLSVLLHAASGVQFFLKQGEELCLSEMGPKGDLLVGEYEVRPSGARVGLTVTDPQGQMVYSKPVSDTGKFAHTSSLDGEYRACFTNNEGHHQKTVAFSFRTGAAAKDYSGMAKKNNLKPIEVELKRLEDVVLTLRDDLSYFKERERQMRATNDSTSARLVWGSFLSMAVLVGMGLMQISYLKRFLKAQRIIS